MSQGYFGRFSQRDKLALFLLSSSARASADVGHISEEDRTRSVCI